MDFIVVDVPNVAFYFGVTHFAQKVHVLADLVVVLLALAAELKIDYDGTAIGPYHDAVGAAGLENSSVTVYDRGLVKEGIGAVKPGLYT